MKSSLLIFIIVLILLTDLALVYPKITAYISYSQYEPEVVNITKAVDGDTVIIDGDISVRLLCINTPEKNKPYYSEAKTFLSRFENKQAEILRDKEDEDRYNRKLRYLFYQDNLINEQILAQGLAHLYLCEGLRFEKQLKKAEQRAMEQELGLWKKSTSKCAGCISLIELNAEQEILILKNSCDFSCSGEVKDEANHFIPVSLKAKEEKTFKSNTKIWNDVGDRLFLRDDSGLLLYYEY